jgi:tripartite-type tricarboxylate transporter receptor subunit TctC
MKLPRRKFLYLAAAAALPAISRSAWAQAYPTRPVRIVVGFAPGGVTDVVARLIGQWLTERLGQPFIIENKPGAANNIGTELVVGAPPDGYTLLLVNTSNAINATLYDKLNFNFIRDIAPVAGITRTPSVMEVNLSFPAKTVSEFIAYAKINPGKISLASAGPGSSSHIYGELFKMMVGVELVHVHYRSSGPALTDLISGQVEATFDPLPASIEFIRAGKLRPLGVTTATRLEVLPHIPAVNEFVPGYEASGYQGIGAPKDTHPDIIDKLNREINTALADPKFKARLIELGTLIHIGSPADFGNFIAAETEKWGKVIRAGNIKP